MSVGNSSDGRAGKQWWWAARFLIGAAAELIAGGSLCDLIVVHLP